MGKIFDFPYRTVAEISLQAVVKNLSTLRSHCRKEVIPVVKADAYGHGMIPISKVLLNRGSCEMLAVATLEEAIELRNHFDTRFNILVLSGFLPHQIDAYYRHNLTPLIHSLPHLKSLTGRAQLPPLHLKLDTGMNRLGIKSDEMLEAVLVLEKLPVKLAGLATHFASSEDLTSGSVDEQFHRFEYWYRKFLQKRLLQTDAKIHIANTGAVLRKKTGFSTAVRPGLSLYGVSPTEALSTDPPLVPALQWKTRIISLKELKPGESVGYGGAYRAEKNERLALLPVGYADGLPRLLSNRGEVLINGQRAPIRGRVSMDLTAVDCSHIDEIKEGGLVTLIGKDGDQLLGASELAHWAQTISYEILCGISKRVQRVYFDSEAT